MRKKMIWSKLPKKDKKHLRENNIYTKYQFEKQVEFMKKERDTPNSNPILCWDCIHIAVKIGLWQK